MVVLISMTKVDINIMKTRVLIPLFLFICIMVSCIQEGPGTGDNDLPNIVFIYADDLGYGDIACFGATDIEMPNIDRIAGEGIMFTDFYSASSVCSPSRAALLTGRLPQRMGINDVFFPESLTGMPPDEITIAEILSSKGYISGIIGKWHLGHHHQFLPLKQGFDSYFGIPYSNDMESVVYMRDNKVESYQVDQKYITKRYTEEALGFIEKNKSNHFFLYIAHNMPYVPIYASDNFTGTSERGLYGDVVQELDWSVGQVISKLDSLKLLEKTLIIFSSDNGPWLVMEEYGGSAGILREGKNFTFEGGFRVPTVAMWKGTIPEGIVCDDLASQMDWFPTFANLAGIELTEDLTIDGVDITCVLYDTGKRPDSSYLFLDGINLQAYREGKWKIKKPYEGYEGSYWKQAVKAHDTLLIDLEKDPGERNNLYPDNVSLSRRLFESMEAKYSKMGRLPFSLVTRTEADNSHLLLLERKE